MEALSQLSYGPVNLKGIRYKIPSTDKMALGKALTNRAISSKLSIVVMKKYFLAALVTFSCSLLYADIDDFQGPQVDLEKTHWEFGFQTGIAIPIGNKSSSLLANNSAFLISDPADPGEDEFAENGYPSPDFTAQTLIKGNVQNALFVGGHLYYRLTSWIAAGIEGSATIQRDLIITQSGPAFQVPIYHVEYESHGEQVVPAIRIGGWMGNIRPYAMAGAGPYYLFQRVTAELLDPDDPDHPPVVAGETNNTYLSALWGGGIDFNFFNQGSVGLMVQYQRVFMPGNNLQYFIPTARFDYHF
jgi:hypothetical protein